MIDTTEHAAEMREVASEWHGGQSSPLYAYASTGTILQPYLSREIRQCMTEVRQGAGGIEEVVGETAQMYLEMLETLLTHVTKLVPEDSDDAQQSLL